MNSRDAFANELTKLSTQESFDGYSYYAISLLGGEDGKVHRYCQTQWCGFTKSKPRREIREAREVDPIKMFRLLDVIREPGVLVNSIKDLIIFSYFGGHTIIEVNIAKKHFPDLIKPREFAKDSSGMGFVDIDSLSENQLQHAPSKKLRMKILNREGKRCAICGRSPFHYVDLELHVHHIIPWGEGGITEEENLVTLCNTCHDGLEPHHDPSLRNYISRNISIQQEYVNKIEKYQSLLFAAIGKVE